MHRGVTLSKIFAIFGGILVVTGLFIGGRIADFYLRSAMVGHRLLTDVAQNDAALFHRSTKRSRLGSAPTATSPARAQQWPAGLLGEIAAPTIGLRAPIEQGTDNAVLNVAVGHLSASVLPGAPGTSVLAAHDVTWFRHIDRLTTGTLIDVVQRHVLDVYRVTWHKVVRSGSPVYNTAGSSIVLEACYPLDALYLTPYRYLVSASLVSQRSIAPLSPKFSSGEFHHTTFPPALEAQNLTLSGNSLPMGTLDYLGSPQASWEESNAPLNLAGEMVRETLGIFKSGVENQPTWISAIVGTRYANELNSVLDGAHVGRFLSSASVSETVIGSSARAGSLSVSFVVTGGTRPGPYRMTLNFVVRGELVAVNGVTLGPT